MTMSDNSSVSDNTLSAFFDSKAEAERALERLRAIGVSDVHLRLTEGAQDADGEGDRQGETAPRTKGFFEALGDFFFPDDDRYTYAEGLSRGGFLVTVIDLPEDLRTDALDILDDEGAVNIDEREAAWRSEGWTGYATDGLGAAGEASPGHLDARPVQAGFADTQPGYVPQPAEFPEDRSASADDRTGLAQPRGRFADDLNELPDTPARASRRLPGQNCG